MPKQMLQQTIKRKLIEQLRIRQETGTFYDVKEPEEE